MQTNHGYQPTRVRLRRECDRARRQVQAQTSQPPPPPPKRSRVLDRTFALADDYCQACGYPFDRGDRCYLDRDDIRLFCGLNCARTFYQQGRV